MPWAVRYCRRRFSRTGSGTSSAPSSAASSATSSVISRETRMRDMIDRAFEEAGFRPGILFESVSTRTVVNMVRQQICPAFFPQSYVESEAPIAYFSVRPRQTWMRCMAYLKGCYLTKPEKYYIELATRYVQGCL